LATYARIWNYSPVEVEWSTFAKCHDLDDDIAGGEDGKERYHGDLLPWKMIYQVPVEIEKYQLLKP
jgi:hypothetical protein